MVVIETQPLTHAARLNHKGARRVGEVDGLADGRRAALFVLESADDYSFIQSRFSARPTSYNRTAQ